MEKDDIAGQAQGLQFISKQQGEYVPNEIMENWKNPGDFDVNDHIFLLTGYIMDGLYALLIILALLVAFNSEIRIYLGFLFKRKAIEPPQAANANNEKLNVVDENKSNSCGKKESPMVTKLKWLFFGKRPNYYAKRKDTKSTQLKPKICFNNRFNKFFYESDDETEWNGAKYRDDDDDSLIIDGGYGDIAESLINMADVNGVTVKKRRVIQDKPQDECQ